MQQPQQRCLIWFELFRWMTFDAGNDPGNQPTRLAHLDHRNQRAILVQSGQASAEVIHLWHGNPRRVCSQRRWCHALATRPIASLERAQGWLKLPNGKAVTGFNHEYKRHGTTTLFASLEVTTSLVKAGHYRRRRRVEFPHFMNRVVAEPPDREIHVIFDNLNTHKPKHDRWLTRQKNVWFHFTPTHACWLNQVEVRFSVLSAKAVAGASCTSPRQVRDQIDAFIAAYNHDAHPFAWTKQTVFSQHPRAKYADLRQPGTGLNAFARW
jgi:transposase